MLLYRIEHGHEPHGPSWDMLWDDFTEDAKADGLVKVVRGDYYHTSGRGFPTPYQEGLMMDDGWVCACADPGQFLRWFSPSMCARLSKLGYRLLVFDVTDPDEFDVGNHQVTFFRHDENIIVSAEDPVAGRARLADEVAADAAQIKLPLAA